MWWHISLGGGSLPACSTSMLRASQHHLHHQDATRICCTALPTVFCDFIKALAAVFTDMASAERFQLTYCFPSWAGFVATAGPRRLGLYWCPVSTARSGCLHEMPWQQLNTTLAYCQPIVGEGHLYTEKLQQLILGSVQLHWCKPV